MHPNMLLIEYACMHIHKLNQNIEEILTKDGKSSRTCRATRIRLEQIASELSQWHIEGFPLKDVVNFGQ